MTPKILIMTAIALTGLTLSSFPVLAEDGSPPAGASENNVPRSDKFEKRGREMFEKTDSDKDGFLSKEEMEDSQRARMGEMFDKTDTNKDGKLSPEELKNGREAMRDRFKSKYNASKAGQETESLKAPSVEGKPIE